MDAFGRGPLGELAAEIITVRAADPAAADAMVAMLEAACADALEDPEVRDVVVDGIVDRLLRRARRSA